MVAAPFGSRGRDHEHAEKLRWLREKLAQACGSSSLSQLEWLLETHVRLLEKVEELVASGDVERHGSAPRPVQPDAPQVVITDNAEAAAKLRAEAQADDQRRTPAVPAGLEPLRRDAMLAALTAVSARVSRQGWTPNYAARTAWKIANAVAVVCPGDMRKHERVGHREMDGYDLERIAAALENSL